MSSRKLFIKSSIDRYSFYRCHSAFDKPSTRYKWKTSLQLVVTYLSLYQGSLFLEPHIVSSEATSKDTAGAFFLIHALIMTSFALPLFYLLAIIGQFSGMGSLQVWKMVPASWGIGLALVLTMFIHSLVNGATVAYALYSAYLYIQVIDNYSIINL